jgi:hypothetical protein
MSARTITKRKTVKTTNEMPNGRRRVDEWYGYRPGQEVPIGTCDGKYPKEKGNNVRFTFRAVVVDAEGNPLHVEVHGGKPMYEKMRTFPFERLVPPKPRRMPKPKS